MEITARARRIGWPVRRADDGTYRITRPDKKIVQVHLTPSDVNADKSVMRALNECGFEDVEAKFLEDKKKANAEKNRKLQREAEEEARRMSDQSAALVKASGGIATEDDDWFLTPHDVMKVRRAFVTPALAQKILTLNPTVIAEGANLSERDAEDYQRNRNITKTQVDKWKRVLAAGRWKLTHEGIAISNTLKLLDGQHRLTAIAESEAGAEFLIFVGVDEATFKVIGQGKARTAADALSTVGATDTFKLSAAARLIYVYLSPDRQNWRRTPVTNDEALELVQQERTSIHESMNFANRLVKTVPIVHSAATAAHFLLNRKHGGAGNPHVQAFFDGLLKNRRLDEMDPRVKLDAYLANARRMGKRVANMDQLALMVITWNLIANGRHVQNIRYTPKTMAVPDILIVPAESKAPVALMMQSNYLSRD